VPFAPSADSPAGSAAAAEATAVRAEGVAAVLGEAAAAGGAITELVVESPRLPAVVEAVPRSSTM
jgi:hypothetical protein